MSAVDNVVHFIQRYEIQITLHVYALRHIRDNIGTTYKVNENYHKVSPLFKYLYIATSSDH